MTAEKFETKNYPVNKPRRALLVVETEAINDRSNRKLCKQFMNFVMACIQINRNDLDFESWRRLEYRQEFVSQKNYYHQLK